MGLISEQESWKIMELTFYTCKYLVIVQSHEACLWHTKQKRFIWGKIFSCASPWRVNSWVMYLAKTPNHVTGTCPNLVSLFPEHCRRLKEQKIAGADGRNEDMRHINRRIFLEKIVPIISGCVVLRFLVYVFKVGIVARTARNSQAQTWQGTR